MQLHRKEHAAKVKAWNKKNRHRRNLRDRYGITVDEYNKILESQSGVCAVCGKPPEKGRRLAVDHDHETGLVRGLLHVKCNTAIGLLGDDPEMCRRALEYLLNFARRLTSLADTFQDTCMGSIPIFPHGKSLNGRAPVA